VTPASFRSRSFVRLAWLLAPFQTIARYWFILRRAVLADIQAVYAGSVLGRLWLVVGLLLMLAVYAVTYAAIFRFKPADMSVTMYVMYVFCGLVPFLAFSAGLSSGTMSLVSNRGLLLNTAFPAELIPLRSVMAASIGMPVGAAIAFAAGLVLDYPSPSWLLVPLVIVLEVMFLTGLCWMLSLVALVFRDIQQIIYYIVMMLSVMTPIAYTPSMVPPGLAILIYINPASYFVISFQYLIVVGTVPPPKVAAIMVAMSVGAFILGFHVCRRAKSAFYDFA
jgi:homopolymeric O-antigen transport system permease protein